MREEFTQILRRSLRYPSSKRHTMSLNYNYFSAWWTRWADLPPTWPPWPVHSESYSARTWCGPGTQPNRMQWKASRKNCAQHRRWHGMTQLNPWSYQQTRARTGWGNSSTGRGQRQSESCRVRISIDDGLWVSICSHWKRGSGPHVGMWYS